jgi:hypothetical protein
LAGKLQRHTRRTDKAGGAGIGQPARRDQQLRPRRIGALQDAMAGAEARTAGAEGDTAAHAERHDAQQPLIAAIAGQHRLPGLKIAGGDKAAPCSDARRGGDPRRKGPALNRDDVPKTLPHNARPA